MKRSRLPKKLPSRTSGGTTPIALACPLYGLFPVGKGAYLGAGRLSIVREGLKAVCRCWTTPLRARHLRRNVLRRSRAASLYFWSRRGKSLERGGAL